MTGIRNRGASEPGRATDPRNDTVATVRVHPLDDPRKLDARRYLLTDDDRANVVAGGPPTPWTLITGTTRTDYDERLTPSDVHHEHVVGWPVQPLDALMRALGHDLPPQAADERSTA